MQAFADKFRQAKNFVKDKMGKKTPDDPEIDSLHKRFTETKHEIKDIVKSSTDALTAIRATLPLRNKVIEQFAQMGIMGDEKQHVGTEVQSFVVFETRHVKSTEQAALTYQKVVLEGAQALLVTIYECKDARRIYEQCKDTHDSAVDKVQSSGNKTPDKQQQAQEELRQAQQKFDASKAHFKLKCQEVEQKKRNFLKNNLTQYIHHIETGVPVGAQENLSAGAGALSGGGDSPRSVNNPPPFGAVSNPAPARPGARPSGIDVRRGSDAPPAVSSAQRGAGAQLSDDQNPFGSTSQSSFSGRPAGRSGSIGGGIINDNSGAAVIDPTVVAAAAQNAPKQVKALYDYDAQTDGELSFHTGDLIKVQETSPDGWWTGELFGRTGQFPITYVDLNA